MHDASLPTAKFPGHLRRFGKSFSSKVNESEILVLRVPVNYARDVRAENRSSGQDDRFFRGDLCQAAASSRIPCGGIWGSAWSHPLQGAYLRPPTRGTTPRVYIHVLESCTLKPAAFTPTRQPRRETGAVGVK
ncbi:hypothetical protein KM043_005061 [Ampulex compressa]|nr:hypothetical protein KM043_005061 [Ampulex compressa]